MADATQTQIRRDTESVLDVTTPALAELAYDQTNKRLRLGDGSTLGAITVPNYRDIQGQVFGYGVGSGSANAITLALNPALIGYSEGVSVEFRATAANSGPTTININGLGVRNIYRKEESSISSMVGGEIIPGGIYRITYDGTQFQLISSAVSAPGALSFIEEKNADVNGILDFTGVMNSTYRGYRIYFENFGRSGNPAEVIMRYSIDNGATFYTNNYAGSSSSGILMWSSGISLTRQASGFCEISAIDDGANMCTGEAVAKNTTETIAASGFSTFKGARNSGSSIINAVRIFSTGGSGTFSGSAAIYGYIR